MLRRSRFVLWVTFAIVGVVIALLRDTGDAPIEVPASVRDGSPEQVLISPVIAPDLEIERVRAGENAPGVRSLAEEAPARDREPGFVSVRARVAEPSGRWLDYAQVNHLLPNRDPFSSFIDFTPARGACELRALDSVTQRTRALEFHVTMLRDGSTALSFDLSTTFVGSLLLVTRDLEASRVAYRVGDPDPVFVVDLAALRRRFATITIDLAGVAASRVPFLVRVEREGGSRDDFDGRLESSNGERLELRDMPAGRYHIAAHAEGRGVEPAVIDVVAGEVRAVDLVVTEECRIEVRVFTDAVERRERSAEVHIGAPAALVGTERIRLPMERVVVGVAEPSSAVDGSLSLRYAGLPPGPLVLVSGSDTLALSLRPGDNGVVDFVLRDTLAITLEVPGVGDGMSASLGAVASLTSESGVALIPRRLDFQLRADGVATASIDLVPGRYRASIEFDDGSRRDGSFDVTAAGGLVVMD